MNNSPPSFSFARRWNVLLNIVISIGAVLALAVMANYLAARHFVRGRWTSNSDLKLSPRTLQVLGMLTNTVHVTVFFDSDDVLYGRVTGLLKEYQFACPKIEVERVDYLRDVASAKAVKAKYKLTRTSDKNLVIFDCEGNPPRMVSDLDLSMKDIQSVIEGKTKEVRRTHFLGEMAFTSALFSVATPHTLRAYFLRGHGEHNPDNTDQAIGDSEFAALLKDECNIPWEKLTLLSNTEVPADCSLLIIAGPTDSFSSEDLDKLRRYLDQGGRMLVLFSYESVNRLTGLEKLLAQYDVAVDNNIVFDSQHSPKGRGDLFPIDLGNHPIASRLQDSVVHLMRPRSVRQIRATAPRAGSSQITELLFTGTNSMVATDFVRGSPQTVKPCGSMPLMVVAEKGGIPGVSAERGTTRLAVIGDSWFAQNEGINSAANRDFAAAVANWLVDQSVLLAGVAPRPIKAYRITMTQSQLVATRWILLVAMPGSVLFIGALVWWRRRS